MTVKNRQNYEARVSGQNGEQACCCSIKLVVGGYSEMVLHAEGFNQLGLMGDHAIHVDDNVKEAVRRLPENLYSNRMFALREHWTCP